MAIVIHIIKGKRYAYSHFRVGNRIWTKYLYPCNAKGKRIDHEHGGGKAGNKTPPQGAPKPRGGYRPRKQPRVKPAASEVRKSGTGMNLSEMQDIKRVLDALGLAGIKKLYKWEGQTIGNDAVWTVPGTKEFVRLTQSKDMSTMNPTTWTVSFEGVHPESVPGAEVFESVTDATLYARKYIERYVQGSDTLKILRETYKDTLGSVKLPPGEQPREPGFKPPEGKKPVVVIPVPEIKIDPYEVGLLSFIEKYWNDDKPKNIIYNGKDYTEATANITFKKLGGALSGWFVDVSPWDKNRFVVSKTASKMPLDAYIKAFRKDLEIVYRQGLKLPPLETKLPEIKIKPETKKEPEPPVTPVIKLPEIETPQIINIPFVPVVIKSYDDGIKQIAKFVKDVNSGGEKVKVRMTPAVKTQRTKWYNEFVEFNKTDKARAEVAYKNYIALGHRTLKGLELETAKPELLTSIYNGLSKSLGRFDLTVNNVGWMTKRTGRAQAYYSRNIKGDWDAVQFGKTFSKDVKAAVEGTKANWGYQKKQNLERIEKGIADPNRPESLKERLRQEKLQYEAAKRWTVDVELSDPLEGTAVHEGFHGVYYKLDLGTVWAVELAKQGIRDLRDSVDAFTVSEYAASKHTELFAETGVAVTFGIEISPKIKAAWDATMEKAERIAWQKKNVGQYKPPEGKPAIVYPPGRIHAPAAPKLEITELAEINELLNRANAPADFTGSLKKFQIFFTYRTRESLNAISSDERGTILEAHSFKEALGMLSKANVTFSAPADIKKIRQLTDEEYKQISDEVAESIRKGMGFNTVKPEPVVKPAIIISDASKALITRLNKEIDEINDDVKKVLSGSDSEAVKADKISINNTMLRYRVDKIKELEAGGD